MLFSLKNFQLQSTSTRNLAAETKFFLPEKPVLSVEARDEVFERPGLTIEVDEHPARPVVDQQRIQAARRGVEALGFLHIGRLHQLPRQVIGPGVVGAGEEIRMPVSLRHRHAAVAAHVGKRVDTALGIARQDDGLVHHLHRHEIAGLLDLFGAGDAEPFLEVNPLLLKLVDCRRIVELARKMPRLRRRGFGVLDAGVHIHAGDRLGQCHVPNVPLPS